MPQDESCTFEIRRATLSPSLSMESWTYGDTPANPVLQGNVENADVAYTFKAKGSSDDTYVANVPVQAGNYVVRAQIAQSANYKATSATAEFSIS